MKDIKILRRYFTSKKKKKGGGVNKAPWLTSDLQYKRNLKMERKERQRQKKKEQREKRYKEYVRKQLVRKEKQRILAIKKKEMLERKRIRDQKLVRKINEASRRERLKEGRWKGREPWNYEHKSYLGKVKGSNFYFMQGDENKLIKNVKVEKKVNILSNLRRLKGDEQDKNRSSMLIFRNMLMRDGKGRKMMNILREVRKSLRKRIGPQGKMVRVINKARNNVLVRIGLFKRRISGVVRSIPVLLPKYKVKRESWKRIAKNSRLRPERSIKDRILGELWDAYKGKGRSVKARSERYNEINRNKVWLKHIRS